LLLCCFCKRMYPGDFVLISLRSEGQMQKSEIHRVKRITLPVRLAQIRFAGTATLAVIVLLFFGSLGIAHAQEIAELQFEIAALPDAPQPASDSTRAEEKPVSADAPNAAAQDAAQTNLANQSDKYSSGNDQSGKEKKNCKLLPCAEPIIDWYKRFADGPQVKPMTPREKAWLATKNLIDPFNLGTILVEGGISVAADSHSAYGPGIPGYGRYVGVSFTEDLTGEFFGTFLIPSIMHQDPHYHREPKATYFRRAIHTVTQVVWTQGDNGKGMLNYANLAGFAIEDEIGNLYVPGRRTNAGATTQRYFIGLATAPISNVITEFLPDVAKRIHVQQVVVQRIINHIANSNSSGT
jgi:hypothetical protein